MRAALLCSLLALLACGARTELPGREICGAAEMSRACRNACGEGVDLCRDGYWQGCEVPLAIEPCADDCGSGELRCEDGVWSECVVPPVTRECVSVCGSGKETCSGGSWQPCDAPQPRPPRLQAVVRDFDDTHPDFERAQGGVGVDPGLVEFELGSDDKPVYAGGSGTLTSSGPEYFDQWYRDVPGVNQSMALDLQLVAEGADLVFFVYDDRSFFPIDGQLLGNQGRNHNYHFTLEAVTSFTYLGGEEFTFSGDDDMFVFINRRLAIDLGGLHQSLTSSVDLDQRAAELALTPGAIYPLHFFFAERHTVESNFTIRTTIAEAGSCD
jgi:fibro-slime domain-containing protein